MLLIPCERDRLDALFSRLNNEGLAAAISSLHPIFTVNSKMVAPNIDFASTIQIKNVNNLINRILREKEVGFRLCDYLAVTIIVMYICGALFNSVNIQNDG